MGWVVRCSIQEASGGDSSLLKTDKKKEQNISKRILFIMSTTHQAFNMLNIQNKLVNIIELE
jgi:hypothetical protein